tara:strand:+ start:996 stop:1949 length:954 start_codon:yes stop_codon:yes gene_type:complete
MKIAAFTEGGYSGIVPRNHPNMRTDLAWWCALDAVHHPFQHLPSIADNEYDFGIVIIPKKRKHLMEVDLVNQLKRVCKKVSTMQESTFWYWQDDPINEQVWYFNFLMEMDLIFCHNDVDLNYYKGITGKRCELMSTLMIEDNIKPHIVNPDARDGVIIGGNFVSIYRGFDSFMVAREISDEIYAPITGRMKEEEKQMDIHHLPWMNWSDWINNLSRFKYGVQLGTPSAGTFNLNCAYHGIPCIGYDTVNTQKICHPKLTIKEGDVGKAKELANKLKTDDNFYKECSQISIRKYNECFSEETYIYNMNRIIKEVISSD